jgi:hypothetical protein
VYHSKAPSFASFFLLKKESKDDDGHDEDDNGAWIRC